MEPLGWNAEIRFDYGGSYLFLYIVGLHSYSVRTSERYRTIFYDIVISQLCVCFTEHDIRMLHYLHIILMCLAAIAVCWGLALLWQSDATQAQCNGYIWLVYLPGSFLVHINNIKAYRLSTFLRAGDRRPKPFSHGRVMKLTIYFVAITAIVLLIATLSDPPTLTKVQRDTYRAQLDYYYCKTGYITPTLLYLLTVGHIICSLFCVISVRNGMEAFKDGMIIKESFLILYACLLVAFVFQNLGLSAANAYMLRSVVMSIGVSLFCMRMLISRCFRHWVSEKIMAKLLVIHANYIKPVVSDYSASVTSAAVGSSHMSRSDADGPLYSVECPPDNGLEEMTAVLSDPVRGKIFQSVAKKALVHENVEFLMAVLNFKQEAEAAVVRHSGRASDDIQRSAKQLFKTYIVAGSENEVNISSKTRANVETMLSKWLLDKPLISTDCARTCLMSDGLKRYDIFEPAFKEIRVMLYQNLWNKFRSLEAEEMACAGSDMSYVVEDL